MYFRRFISAAALAVSFAVLASVCLPSVQSLQVLTSANASGIQFITHAEFKDLAALFPNLYAIMSSLPVRLDLDSDSDSNEQRSNNEDTLETTTTTQSTTESTTIQAKVDSVQTLSTPIRIEPTTVTVESTTLPIESTTVVTQPPNDEMELTTVSTLVPAARLDKSAVVKDKPVISPRKSSSMGRLINKQLTEPKTTNVTVAAKKPSIAWFINSTHSDTLNMTNSTGKVHLLNALLNTTGYQNLNTSLGYNPIVRIENVPKSSDFWFLFNPVNASYEKLQSDRKEKYDMFAYNPAWIIGLSVIGTVIAVFFLGCVVAICYTRRPYRRPGKVYEVESANRKNNQVPQIPTINPATRTATLMKNKESFY